MSDARFVCGAECGIVAAGTAATGTRHWTAVGAPVSIVTTPTAGTHSTRAYKFDPAAATTDQLVTTYPSIASPATCVARFYIKWDVLPNAVHGIFSTATGQFGVRYNPTGTKLEAFVGATGAGVFAGSFTVTTGTWYRIDVKVVRGTTWTCDWQVDGAAQTQASKASQSAGALTDCRFGCNTGGSEASAAATATYYIDDMILSGASADYPFGAGGVQGLYPDSDGTHSYTNANDFLKNNTTNLATPSSSETDVHSFLQTAPLSTATAGNFMAQNNIASTSYVAVGVANPTASYTAINAVNLVSVHHSNGTGANTQTLQILDGATTDSAAALVDWSDVTISTNNKTYGVAPSTSAAWTLAKVQALQARWGFSTDTSAVPYLDGICYEVDGPITTGASLALSPATVTVTAQAVDTTEGAVSLALTPATVTATAQTFARTLGGVSLAVSPATVATTAQASGITNVVSLALSPATVTTTGQTFGVTPGAATRALAPATVTTTAQTFAVSAAVSVAQSPATVTATAQTMARTLGSTSVAVTPATVTVTGIAQGITNAGVGAPPLSPSIVTVTAQVMGITAGAVSRALSPATVTVTSSAAGIASAVTLVLAPATVTASAQSQSLSVAGGGAVALAAKVPVASSARALPQVAFVGVGFAVARAVGGRTRNASEAKALTDVTLTALYEAFNVNRAVLAEVNTASGAIAGLTVAYFGSGGFLVTRTIRAKVPTAARAWALTVGNFIEGFRVRRAVRAKLPSTDAAKATTIGAGTIGPGFVVARPLLAKAGTASSARATMLRARNHTVKLAVASSAKAANTRAPGLAARMPVAASAKTSPRVARPVLAKAGTASALKPVFLGTQHAGQKSLLARTATSVALRATATVTRTLGAKSATAASGRALGARTRGLVSRAPVTTSSWAGPLRRTHTLGDARSGTATYAWGVLGIRPPAALAGKLPVAMAVRARLNVFRAPTVPTPPSGILVYEVYDAAHPPPSEDLEQAVRLMGVGRWTRTPTPR